MKDFEGQEVEAGDEVLFIQTCMGKQYFAKSVVESVTDCTCRVKYHKVGNSDRIFVLKKKAKA